MRSSVRCSTLDLDGICSNQVDDYQHEQADGKALILAGMLPWFNLSLVISAVDDSILLTHKVCLPALYKCNDEHAEVVRDAPERRVHIQHKGAENTGPSRDEVQSVTPRWWYRFHAVVVAQGRC